MTSYKKVAQELQEVNHEVVAENARLRERIEYLQDGIIQEMGGALNDQDAKDVLRAFADRARNKDELLLLIRTITRL